jgi:DNA-binding beta-propeller fold protein YncE
VKRLLLLLFVLLVPASPAAGRGGSPVALVTAESQNQLIAFDLESWHVLRRLHMPADPQNVEANQRDAVVVSTRAGAVTLVDVQRLRVRKVLRGLALPHIVALSPAGRYAYVTDDARGQLLVIDLSGGRILRRIFVGLGAHHMSFRPHHHQLWIALGERARTIVIVRTNDPARPRVVGRFVPGGLAHDLAFPAGGRRVWVTYDDRSTVAVFDATTQRLLFRLPGGSPPQHVAFRRYAYVTSGNDGSLRIFSVGGRLLGIARTPIGSHNLCVDQGRVLTSSLTNGSLTELGVTGRLLRTGRVASSARDVALAFLP